MNFYDYKHFMVDIETLGVISGSIITEIAIVQFDLRNGTISKELLLYPSIDEQAHAGMTMDWGTLVWHAEHDTGVFSSRKEKPISEVVSDLNYFIQGPDWTSTGSQTRYFIWSNSPNFDMVMIQEMIRKVKVQYAPVWRYRQLMDFRTAVFMRRLLRPEIEDKKIEVAHNALADCKTQIQDLVDNIRLIQQSD